MVCHTILAQGRPPEPAFTTDARGLEFKHPEDIGDAWQQMKCTDWSHRRRPVTGPCRDTSARTRVVRRLCRSGERHPHLEDGAAAELAVDGDAPAEQIEQTAHDE
jgi:hypothetical protein